MTVDVQEQSWAKIAENFHQNDAFIFLRDKLSLPISVPIDNFCVPLVMCIYEGYCIL